MVTMYGSEISPFSVDKRRRGRRGPPVQTALFLCPWDSMAACNMTHDRVEMSVKGARTPSVHTGPDGPDVHGQTEGMQAGQRDRALRSPTWPWANRALAVGAGAWRPLPTPHMPTHSPGLVFYLSPIEVHWKPRMATGGSSQL